MRLPPYTFSSREPTIKEILSYHKEVLARMEVSSIPSHLPWYTHKNPYGCWICDLVLEVRTLLNYIEDGVFISTKSSRPDDMSRSKTTKSRDTEMVSNMSEVEFRSEVLSRLDSIIQILNQVASATEEDIDDDIE